MKGEPTKKRLKVYIPLGLIIIAVLAGVWYWYKDYSMYITSDDAHVDADNVSIGSKILGRISTIYAVEGDIVKKGTILADIDSSDLIAQRNQSVALKNQALANLRQTEVKYSSDQKSLKVLEINLDRANEDLTRAKNQSAGGVITSEQFYHIKKSFETAQAQLDAAKAQLLVSKSMISSASAAAETSDTQINVLNTQLKNTKLFAPADGIIAKRWLMAGDIVQPGQSVFTLTLSNDLWVVSYLEETKIAEIHVGQSVKLSIDAFPKIYFSGKVFQIGSSTASVFSLIPANNASGNFTKVTQRIPIKISIDNADNNKDIASFNILSGMSVVVKISKSQ